VHVLDNHPLLPLPTIALQRLGLGRDNSQKLRGEISVAVLLGYRVRPRQTAQRTCRSEMRRNHLDRQHRLDFVVRPDPMNRREHPVDVLLAWRITGGAITSRIDEAIESFRGREDRSVSLGFRREAQGPLLHVEITPAPLSAGVLFAKASRDSARVIPQRSKSVAYYKPWSLAGHRHWRLLVNALSGQLRSCDALVLDLRGGIGGASPDYAEFFVGRSPELTLLGPRQAKRIVNPHWRKPVVLLVDGTTRSGNEVLAFSLQRAGIRLVDTRTPGEVTVARHFILSDASLLLVATCAVAVDGAILEGNGVQPDVVVPREIAYAAGNDPQLDAALKLATR
jgi:carboxyl-terminal processing protease